MKQYLDLVQHVLENGTRKENRTGVDTLSTFGYYYEHDMKDGFPMLTTKTITWKNIVVEMLWFLSGQTDISILKRHGCKFWDAWADENGNVPSAYGAFWRNFPVHQSEPSGDTDFGFNDQVTWVLNELRRNPMSRRMIISAWAPGNAQTSKLPPCHLLYAFNVQNQYSVPAHTFMPGFPEPIKCEQKLCLHLTQRSADIALGVPYNIASYALLLSLFSRFSGIKPGIFGHTLIDAHIYTSKPDGSQAEYDHVPGLKSQLHWAPTKLPTLHISDAIKDLSDIEALMHESVSTDEIMKHFVLEGYNPRPEIKFKVAV